MILSENEEEIARLEFKGILNEHPSHEELEAYYSENILPNYDITGEPIWERHIQTNPDNFLHLFTVDDKCYALAFDDYPSGFSVEGDSSVIALKNSDGIELLSVSSPYDRYIENAFGYFKLFKVVDDAQFASLIGYLENEYKKLKDEWHEDSWHLVAVARDILQMAETASSNHDNAALHAVESFIETLIHLNAVDSSIDLAKLAAYIRILSDAEFGYEMYSKELQGQVADDIYRSLAYEVSTRINNIKYDVKNLGPTLTLVYAMYAKDEAGTTSGISVSLLFGSNEVSFPRDHFINNELQQYMLQNPFITANNVKEHMPETLGNYKLVKGSVTTQKVFRRELEYISF